MPKCAKAKLTKPTKFTTARIMVQLEEVSKTNSFSSSPIVPMAMRIKPLNLMNCLIPMSLHNIVGRDNTITEVDG